MIPIRRFRTAEQFWEVGAEDCPQSEVPWDPELDFYRELRNQRHPPERQEYRPTMVRVTQREGAIGEWGTLTRTYSEIDRAEGDIRGLIALRESVGYVEMIPVAIARPTAVESELVPPGARRLVHPSTKRFWQIEQVGTQLAIVTGDIGEPGERQVRELASEAEAIAECADQIEKKLRKGFEIAIGGDAPPSSRAISDELEREILENPDRDETYAVYADWLQEQGDPHGELAIVQARRAADPDDKTLRQAEEKLAWKHRAHFFGSLARFVPLVPQSPMALMPSWRHGFLRTLELHAATNWTPHVEIISELIEALGTLPAAKFLRELAIACPTALDGDEPPIALARALSGLPILRRIVLGLPDCTRPGQWWERFAHPSGELWRAAGRVESLTIRAIDVDLGLRAGVPSIAMPALRELVIETARLSVDSAVTIADGTWPALERLVVWFGTRGDFTDWREAMPLVDVMRFPRVRHLGICNATFVDGFVEVLAQTPFLAQLETLDVSNGDLSIEGARTIARDRARFAHLAHLDVSNCLLDGEAVELLETVAKRVTIGEQRYAVEGTPNCAVHVS